MTGVNDQKANTSGKVGGARPNSGPKKGAKYKKTLEWEQFGKQVLEKGMPRFLEIMETTDDEKFARTFLDILEYFKPKQARTELTGKDGGDLNINIIDRFTSGEPQK